MSAVLMYHYLGDKATSGLHRGLWASEREFREQLRMLTAMGRRSVDGTEYAANLASGRGKDTIWITFDDGRIDNYEIAFPALVRAGYRPTFFVTVGACLEGRTGYTPLSGLKEMAAAGMEIGSHTLMHRRLTELSPERRCEGIAGSRKRLGDALQMEVTSFCYPYGNWNAAVAREVEETGYRVAATTMRDNRNRPEHRFELRRVMVQPGRVGWQFRYLLSPLYHWVHDRKNRRRWKKLGKEK